jgi:3-isopropylmalate dehydrogenase
MHTYSLAVIDGDGIGPDVTAAALLALDAASARFGFGYEVVRHDLGAERYLRTGDVLPADELDSLRTSDAILLGAVGDPRVQPGILERGLIVGMRTALAQSVNLRPIKLHAGVRSPIAGLRPEDCDLVILRENTEGLYAGGGSTVHGGTDAAVALQTSVTTVRATEEIVDYAFRLAQRRRGRLTLCHKTNILVHAGQLWDETVARVGASYPDVEVDYVHVDAMCMHLPTNPGRFDVVVTDNLFGDIISDLGATIQGGLGVAASGNLNIRGTAPSMFEPIHGSAPDIAGQGIANPVAAVLSASLMLATLGQVEAALTVEAAAASVQSEADASGRSWKTSEVADAVAERVSTVEVPDAAGSLLGVLGDLGPLSLAREG